MSRYSLKPLPQRSDIFEVAVGWDPGLSTFFVMVFGVADAGRDTDVRYWKGGQPGQIATVEELQGAGSPLAEIPLELVRRLANDQHTPNLSHPRRFSRFISKLLGAATE